MGAEERNRLRARYGKVSVADINAFLERLPRDMLFVMRTWSLVRNLNRSLGGTSAQRFLIIAEHAAAGATPEPPSDAAWRLHVRARLARRWARWRMFAVVRAINGLAKLSVQVRSLLATVRAAMLAYWPSGLLALGSNGSAGGEGGTVLAKAAVSSRNDMQRRPRELG